MDSDGKAERCSGHEGGGDNACPFEAGCVSGTQCPLALKHEISTFCEVLRDRGTEPDLGEQSLDVLARMLSRLPRDETGVSGQGGEKGFWLRNRHVVGRVGAFLGCMVVNNIGGRWEREGGGLVVGGIGPERAQFDSFEAVVRAAIRPESEGLQVQYEQLRLEAQGRGPRILFRTKVLEALERSLPSVRVGRVRGFDIWLTNGWKINLGNIFTTCISRPGRSGGAIEGFVSALMGLSIADWEMPGFEAAREKLFPVLKPRAFMQRPLGKGISASESLAWQDFCGELTVCFVYDDGASGCMRFVCDDDLELWGIGVDEVRARALDNLANATTESGMYELAVTRFGKAAVINANDGYDAARILLPGLHKSLRGHLGKSFFVAVPCRDLLVAFERKTRLLDLMKERIEEDANLGAYGLTDALFVCDAAGIHPY